MGWSFSAQDRRNPFRVWDERTMPIGVYVFLCEKGKVMAAPTPCSPHSALWIGRQYPEASGSGR